MRSLVPGSVWCLVCGLLLAGLVVPAMGAMGPARAAKDLPGNDINDGWFTHVSSKEECAAMCDANAQCLAATYIVPGVQGPEGHCWLKNPVPAETDNFNAYSFYKIIPGCNAAAPVADFFAAVVPIGYAPFNVLFTDQSTGAFSWYWDFGDMTSGPENTQQNPVHTYTVGSTNGIPYTVKLTVAGACPGQMDSRTRSDYIMIYDNSGLLIIDSVPSGANVYLNGHPQGVTPFAKIIVPGTFNLRLAINGYEDYNTQVTVVNNQKTSVKVTLVSTAGASATASATTSAPAGGVPPATTTQDGAYIIPPVYLAGGVLKVTTTPDGASVQVDDGSRGYSPVTLPGIEPGTHTVLIVKDGYVDYQGTVTIQDGQTTPLNVNLVGAPATGAGTGTLEVSSSPPGAKVYVDGSERGTTPLTLGQVAAGLHTIVLKKAGYEDAEWKITVKGGSIAKVNSDLVPTGEPLQPSGSGTLVISSVPAGAIVFLDGEKMGTTPARIPGVSAGTHMLRLSLENHADVNRAVQVTGGTENAVSIEFPVETKTPGFGMALSLAAVGFAALIVVWKRRDR